jgi:mannose-1-phosphate guanylyltransferase
MKTWSIVLAGGEGERLKPFVRAWKGEGVPKQYCAFTGTRSMLEHTLSRADRVSGPTRKVTVIGRNHLPYVGPRFARHEPGRVLLQPANRDTAAGIFLPLTYVRAMDPDATVAIFPSDHFIFPEDRFITQARAAAAAARELRDKVILLGVVPESAESEYGWISPGLDLGPVRAGRVRSVRDFIEKPDAATAFKAKSRGGLWNSFVMTAQVDTLWRMGHACFPEMMQLFELLGDVIGTTVEGPVLQSIYQTLPQANFSSGLLQRMPESVAVMELTNVLWSDWGRPERIAESIRAIGRTPAFPEAAQPVFARSILHSARWAGRSDLTRVARSPGRSVKPSAVAPAGVV